MASPKQLQVVLFDELGLPKTKKIKTGYTTDAESLDWLHQKSGHPVLTSLLRIRETKKLGTTVEGLIAEIAKDGRIHTHFQQTVAATGLVINWIFDRSTICRTFLCAHRRGSERFVIASQLVRVM